MEAAFILLGKMILFMMGLTLMLAKFIIGGIILTLIIKYILAPLYVVYFK